MFPYLLTGHRLPSRLRDLVEPPAALYVRGELPRGPAVAIVGTRTPTPEASRFAKTLASDLAAAGVAILSGGAAGIDTAAHRGALAARGITVVVAPAGYEVPYPEGNATLFRRIVQSAGAYVSLVPDLQVAEQAAFFARNACLAALSHAVVVVQAPYRSGARNAAAWARRLGRPLLAVPSAPWIERGRGCLIELKRGALICESARSVLDVLERSGLSPVAISADARAGGRTPVGGSGVGRKSTSVSAVGPTETESVCSGSAADPVLEKVLRALDSGVVHPDELCRILGLSAAQVHQALLTLRLGGVLVPGPYGGFD